MPKSTKSQNGAGKQAKTAEVVSNAVTPQDAELIRGYVRSLEHLNDEAREIGENKSAIYKEAKINGLSTFAIRETVKRRLMDPGVLELQDDLVKIYSEIAAGAKVRTPEPVAPNMAAHTAGFEDGLAGHRDHAASWRGKFGEVDYELGHDAGVKRRQELQLKKDLQELEAPPQVVALAQRAQGRRRRGKGQKITIPTLADQQAKAVAKARKPRGNGRARPTA